jgi:hypothetical protein
VKCSGLTTKVATYDSIFCEIRVFRDHFRGEGLKLDAAGSCIPNLEAFDGGNWHANHRSVHVRRPLLQECRLVDQRLLTVSGQCRSAGHYYSLTMRCGGAAVDVEADLRARRVLNDVVVVRQSKQDLIFGDCVRDDDRSRTLA